jgi:hypothetical protein
MTTKKSMVIKLVALLGTGLGFAATLISDWATDREQKEYIDEKVNEKFAEYSNEKESE